MWDSRDLNAELMIRAGVVVSPWFEYFLLPIIVGPFEWIWDTQASGWEFTGCNSS